LCAHFVGLEAIHEAKYVHRDVSSGNILLVLDSDGGKRGIIIDLEYAKEIDSEYASHGIKTVSMHLLWVHNITQL
jgi:serine/threonine protein kinase